MRIDETNRVATNTCYNIRMLAPVRNVRTTRYGDYLQVGDKSVFVPGESSFDKNGPTHQNKEIRFAVFTDGTTKTEIPSVVVAKADEETKDVLKRYYEDLFARYPDVAVSLHY